MPRSPQASRKGPAPTAQQTDAPAASKAAKAKAGAPAGPKTAKRVGTAASKVAGAKPATKAAAKKVTSKTATKPAAKIAAKVPVKAVVVRNPVAQTALDAGGDLALRLHDWLDDAKAENITVLDIRGKTSIGDCMMVATGRTDRHVGAIADQLLRHLKEFGVSNARAEGLETCDWVLVDVGAIIIHVFRPDVREFYNLEKMWSGERPGDPPAHEPTH